MNGDDVESAYDTTVHLVMPPIFQGAQPWKPDTGLVCVCHTDDFVLLEELLEKEKIRSKSFTLPIPQQGAVAYVVKRLEITLGDMKNTVFTGICTPSALFYMRAELKYERLRTVRELLVGRV